MRLDRRTTGSTRGWLLGGAALTGLMGLSAHAGDLGSTVTFEDASGLGRPHQAEIERHLGAALAAWSQHVQGSASFEVLVRISHDVLSASGASTASGLYATEGGRPVFEQGTAYELRTGIDPNGTAPDIVLDINPGYLQHALWFDPDPYTRTAPVAASRIDATSVFIHEIGHALAFNGWRGNASALDHASTWDRNVSFERGVLAFNGTHATAVHGGPVPVTFGYDFHIGNTHGPGSDLRGDVMNGVALIAGQRYEVSRLDVAMLQDMGVAVSHAPEPATFVTMLAGLAAVSALRCRRVGRAA